MRSSYLDTREQLPYADDSRVCSPAGSLDGQVMQLSQGLASHSRHNSYSSHTSRLTYNSHAELTRGTGTLSSTTNSHIITFLITNNNIIISGTFS